jgi:beta-lactamase class A
MRFTLRSMSHSFNRRTFLLAAALVPLVIAGPLWAVGEPKTTTAKTQVAQAKLAKLESQLQGRLGVFALNTADGTQLSHRADERFPLNSTFKLLLASAILRKSQDVPGLMQQRIKYSPSNLVTYSPVTEKHLKDGMTVAELCAAAVQYSDNTAANLLMKNLGGPGALTAFARSVGDRQFRLNRWETALNTAIPGDPRDTSTPRAIGLSLRKLVLGDGLKAPQRQQLQQWLRGNTTGDTRIRAGVPAGWQVGDKTGTGDYGTAHDVAVLWPPSGAPIVLTVYTAHGRKDAKARGDVIASAARIVAAWAR